MNHSLLKSNYNSGSLDKMAEKSTVLTRRRATGLLLGLAAFLTGAADGRAASDVAMTPPDTIGGIPVDTIMVRKGERRMDLMARGRVVRTYRIALGWNPVGHKVREGDGRTPEGAYIIDWRNPNSSFHRSLHISYPRRTDQATAAGLGVDPGGAIMIHGLPNRATADIVGHPYEDWTNGCIAVTSEEMDEIWHLVADGTVIYILP